MRDHRAVYSIKHKIHYIIIVKGRKGHSLSLKDCRSLTAEGLVDEECFCLGSHCKEGPVLMLPPCRLSVEGAMHNFINSYLQPFFIGELLHPPSSFWLSFSELFPTLQSPFWGKVTRSLGRETLAWNPEEQLLVSIDNTEQDGPMVCLNLRISVGNHSSGHQHPTKRSLAKTQACTVTWKGIISPESAHTFSRCEYSVNQPSPIWGPLYILNGNLSQPPQSIKFTLVVPKEGSGITEIGGTIC